MIKLILSEWLKIKRTSIKRITFLLPFLISGCIIGYIAVHKRGDHFEADIFETFFEVWAIFIIPIIISVFAGQIVYEEELAGSFNGFLSERFSRYRLYLGKFFIISIVCTITLILGTSVFCIETAIFFPGTVHIEIFFIAGVLLLLVGILPLIAIHLWISFVYGIGASIGMGIIGLLMTTMIGGSELGNSIWRFVPWALPIRLVKAIGPYLEFSANMAKPPQLISSGWATTQLLSGIISVIIYLIIMLGCGIVWFYRWEGRKHYE